MPKQTLAEHKTSVSAKVLLAGIRFAQEDLAEVVRLLDETEPQSPTDLWIYMNRLRIEGLRSPSRDLLLRVLEIARSPAFPPNARETAADIAKHLPHQSGEYEEVLRQGSTSIQISAWLARRLSSPRGSASGRGAMQK